MTSSVLSATSVLFFCFVACISAARLPFHSTIYEDVPNAISPVAKYGGQPTYQERDWVRIKQSGPRMNRVSPGGRLELECEVIGSPPPSVQWYHNAKPISQGLEENNSVGDVRIGSITSRLFIDCATVRHHGTYTCVANAGTETTVSKPSLVFVQGNNASGLLPSCSQSVIPPRILTWSKSMLETMGNDVVLPCVSSGSPQPQVYWIDSHNNIITSGSDTQADDRYKLSETGDLLISAVQWSDMGDFTCVAESPLGRDTVTTFLYPMAKSR